MSELPEKLNWLTYHDIKPYNLPVDFIAEIVRRYNVHADLVKALEDILKEWKPPKCNTQGCVVCERNKKIQEQAKQALDRARGKE